MKMRILVMACAILSTVGFAVTATPRLELVSQWGGTAGAVAAVGTTVLLGQGPRLVLIDMAVPEAPVELGRSDPLPGVILDLAVDGAYVYAVTSIHGLRILSIADPTRPIEVGALAPSDAALAVVVQDDLAYVADRYAGLSVVSIADKTAPELQAVLDTPGAAEDLAIDGDLLYLADRNGGVRVVDVSVPSQPREIGALETIRDAYAIETSGDIACVADRGGWLHTLSITAPQSPVLLASVPVENPTDISILDDTVYVSLLWAETVAFDISDPGQPEPVGGVAEAVSAAALASELDRLYVAGGEGGLYVVSHEPGTPIVLGRWDGAAYGATVLVAEDELVLLGGINEGIHVLSTTDPAAPTQVGYLPFSEAAAMAREGETLFAVGMNVLIAVDLTDPTSPVERGRRTLPSNGVGVALIEAGVAVLTERDGLLIMDTDDLGSLQVIGRLSVDGYAQALTVVGDRAYIAAGGLHIVSLADPRHPKLMGSFDVEGLSHSIAVEGSRAYLGVGSALHVISVQDPFLPVGLGSQIFGLTTRLAIGDGHLVLGLERAGVRLVDATDPARVRTQAQFDTAGRPRALAVWMDTVFVADEDGGLVILRILDEAP